jgi:hypothetical protein
MTYIIDEATDKLVFGGVKSQKQKMFIVSYCHPATDTYDNATQSYAGTYKSKNLNVAAVEAHRTLNLPYIQEAIRKYRDYLSEQIGFRLDWLDSHLRELWSKTNEAGAMKTELSVLKAIGDRIGAFKDNTQASQGINVEMSPEKEKMCNRIMAELMAEEKRNQIKKVD